jgi:hypothetical protein
MIVFNVVKEPHGWAVRMGERMTTPFWSRDLAIQEANCLAESIRCHGECAEVVVEDGEAGEALGRTHQPSALRGGARPRQRWTGPQ